MGVNLLEEFQFRKFDGAQERIALSGGFFIDLSTLFIAHRRDVYQFCYVQTIG